MTIPNGLTPENLYSASFATKIETAEQLMRNEERSEHDLGLFLCCVLPIALATAKAKVWTVRGSDLLAEMVYDESFERLVHVFKEYRPESLHELDFQRLLNSVLRMSFINVCKRQRHKIELGALDDFQGSYTPYFDTVIESKEQIQKLVASVMPRRLKKVLNVLLYRPGDYIKEATARRKARRRTLRQIDIPGLAGTLNVSTNAARDYVFRLRRTLCDEFPYMKGIQ